MSARRQQPQCPRPVCGQDPARLHWRRCSAVGATHEYRAVGTQEVHSHQADQAARRPGCPPTFGDLAVESAARPRSRPRGPVPVSSSGRTPLEAGRVAISLALSTPRGPRRTASTAVPQRKRARRRRSGTTGNPAVRHQGYQCSYYKRSLRHFGSAAAPRVAPTCRIHPSLYEASACIHASTRFPGADPL